MISLHEARQAVAAAVVALPAEDVAVADALGRILAEDVLAGHHVPPFANSAMDGFAVRSADGDAARRIVGESRAGVPAAVALDPGDAVRISTGAALPAGADAVVPVEEAEEHEGIVQVRRGPPEGVHVRAAGEDLRAGRTALRAGTRLGPAELGVAATAGSSAVSCTAAPRVAIVSTGDELAAPGRPLAPGQIHESNTIVLAALATLDGARVVSRRLVPDTFEATRAALSDALDAADLVLVSGGVSVGPHDHVKPALHDLGVTEIFWRVALKPGKPVWFGRCDDVLVLGLPGNPASSHVTYALFARLALLALQRAAPVTARRGILAEPLRRHAGRDEAVRVRPDDEGRLHHTGPQDSHLLTSMLGATALAIVPRGDGELAAGAIVDVEPL